MIDLGSKNEPIRVALYIRVSTQEQQIDGYGLEAQKSRLLEYIKFRGPNIISKPEWIFTDTHTGSDLNRPQLNQMLKGVREGKFNAILVWKLDRLSRYLPHLLSIFEELEKNNVQFISDQENIDFRGPFGKLMFQTLGAYAQFERALIKGRTHMGRVTSAEMGNFTGTTIPYGYKPIPNPSGKGKRLEIIESERTWVRTIYKWYIYEDMGYGLIVKELNRLKVSKGKFSHAERKIGRWTIETVMNILTNSIYRGEFVANRKDEDGRLLPEDKWTYVRIPPCVSEFTFQQAQTIRKNKTAGRRNTVYLLSGKLKDMTLEKPKAFVGCKRSRGGYSYRRKQFTKDGVFYSLFEIPAKQIEEYVWQKTLEALSNPEEFIQSYLAKQYADPGRIERLETQIDLLREKKINEELAISRIEEAYERGTYSREKLNIKIEEKVLVITETEASIREIEKELNFLGTQKQEIEKLKEAAEQVQYMLTNLDHQKKRVLMDLFVDRVEMYKELEEGKKRANITAKIYYRFNPLPVKKSTNRVTQENVLSEAKNEALNLNKSEAGGRSRT